MQTNYMTKRHKFSFYENVVALKIPHGDVKSWHVRIISSAATNAFIYSIYNKSWFLPMQTGLLLVSTGMASR